MIGGRVKLPEIETPDEASAPALEWAYRLGALPWNTTVEDVALLIQAAMDEAVRREREKWVIDHIQGVR